MPNDLPSNVVHLSNFTVKANQPLLNPILLTKASNVTHLVDLQIITFVSETTISAGSNLTFYLEVKNVGPSDSTNLIANFQVPSSLQGPFSVQGFDCVRSTSTATLIVCNHPQPISVYDPLNNVDNIFSATFKLFVPNDWNTVASPVVVLELSSDDYELDISNNIQKTDCIITSSYDLAVKAFDFPGSTFFNFFFFLNFFEYQILLSLETLSITTLPFTTMDHQILLHPVLQSFSKHPCFLLDL